MFSFFFLAIFFDNIGMFFILAEIGLDAGK